MFDTVIKTISQGKPAVLRYTAGTSDKYYILFQLPDFSVRAHYGKVNTTGLHRYLKNMKDSDEVQELVRQKLNKGYTFMGSDTTTVVPTNKLIYLSYPKLNSSKDEPSNPTHYLDDVLL